MNTSTNVSNNKGSKGVKEEDNVALTLKGKSKGPSQGQGSQGEKKKKNDLSNIKCLSVASLTTTVPGVLKGIRRRRISRIRRQHS